MNTIVAVSGGIDSVVLLDMLVKDNSDNLTVAYFDHGMRPDSDADMRFVKALANRYGLEFVTKREELSGANEETARRRRYKFLFEQAKQKQARVATAHHLDDLVETVALNLARGTRWRGLAAMSDSRIWRPLLNRTKSELEQYALDHRLEWCEDTTNRQNIYARNRLRKKLFGLPYARKKQIYELWQKQMLLKQMIEKEIMSGGFPMSSRYFMIMIDDTVASELIYDSVFRNYGVSLLSSQVAYALLAIKIGQPLSRWQIGQGLVVAITVRDVTIARDVSLSKGS